MTLRELKQRARYPDTAIPLQLYAVGVCAVTLLSWHLATRMFGT
jgi:hypothetical protein